MALGTTLFIVLLLVVAVWIIFEFKRFRHKIVAILLISLILFFYFTFNAVVIQNHDVDLKTSSGLISAGKIYLAWMGSMFENVKEITTNAIHMNWNSNSSAAK
jgi:glucan phosphoethanolaminetransferase (alkaline phosphatase superfamily)